MDEKAATILVVDDEEDIREVLKDRLEFSSYRVLTASNGVEGLARIRVERPDVVLLDLQMPVLDGLGMLQGIAAGQLETCVIIMTAHGTIQRAVQAMKGGATDFLLKPIDPEDVERVIRRALEQARLRRENLRLQQALREAQDQLLLEMQRELRIAHEMQMGLMPQESPTIAGFEIAGMCVPANEVGGDYFNYVWLDEGRTRLAFLVADVSGKGMAAATVTMRFNEVLRYEVQGRSAPQDILRGLDAALRGRIGELTFVTGCIGALDVAKRVVRIASAAHPMAYHYTAKDGLVRQVAPSGLPMGMTLPPGVGGDYPEVEALMEAGDLLVIYSDGIPEAQDAKGAFYEDARVAEVIRGRAGQASAQTLMDHLLRDVDEFRGEIPQLDDMTVVVVKCLE
ncbi:MAG: hypothetical protein A3F84_25460 [Candidatus Handelsmanbacteria bacterium RIFCSPLOWO2_12_FULL_64_10]|uniref:Response regulatory domain-containing protein n=1 Tax=Handelsmanbacteria sp. (strain RIFCSPLOWO2_12_FULL_64_10) TaxID=1817868 RepID=A0A1F6CTP4_HANXR|nr:MAG: hypothetical protein A3F84_25460 [Candidatus Handelsmanbacteria bacterium RIFCSPLOWO2_12_FULL_64_10]